MILKCENLSFRYDQETILQEISFEIESGVFCAILGRNGSGKTTLLHCLNGILKPATGIIEIDGLDIRKMSQRNIAQKIGMVPQENEEIFPFEVPEVVVMGRSPYLGFNERPGKADYRKAGEILNSLNAGYLADRNFNRISGGERRIVLLARALMQSSRTLLFDEPTNHLDFHNQYSILSLIKMLCTVKNARILASMHDPNLAYLFADQVILLKDGKILKQGPTQEVMTDQVISELYDTQTQKHEINDRLSYFLPSLIKSGGLLERN